MRKLKKEGNVVGGEIDVVRHGVITPANLEKREGGCQLFGEGSFISLS